MSEETPEQITRKIIEQCADCDQCREFMRDTPCIFFARLYRLYDREKDSGKPITSDELKRLVELCNMCGTCSCPGIRTEIREARDKFVARDGLKPAIRILEDVQKIGQICGAYPRLANLLSEIKPVADLGRRLAGVHRDRKLPKFPMESFDAWAKSQGLDRKRQAAGAKVAFFAGCTARYIFPQVAQATVEVLERNGIQVYFPEQKCCGMPSMLEGDREFTFDRARFNVGQLEEAVDEGYDIVTACPTCGYMLKAVLSNGAYFSKEYRSRLLAMKEEAGGDLRKLQESILREESSRQGRATAASPNHGKPTMSPVAVKLIVNGVVEDQGYFAEIDGLKRIKIASHTYDAGEYMRELNRTGRLVGALGPVTGRMAYYASCHLKEQNMGQPWMELLGLVPGISLQGVGGPFDCCGLSGVMGFKKEFHAVSMAMGRGLMDKIKAINPEILVTDCLSCRMQFNQALPYAVLHPVEVLNQAYSNYRAP